MVSLQREGESLLCWEGGRGLMLALIFLLCVCSLHYHFCERRTCTCSVHISLGMNISHDSFD